MKNQYRALDDDEAEFLDSVLEGTRKKEAEVQKDTLEQLDAFRRRQEEAERKAFEEEQRGDEGKEGEKKGETHTQWVAAGSKRKKGHELLKGVKIRRKSEGAEEKTRLGDTKEKVLDTAQKAAPTPQAVPVKPVPTSPPKISGSIALNLGYASSDDED